MYQGKYSLKTKARAFEIKKMHPDWGRFRITDMLRREGHIVHSKVIDYWLHPEWRSRKPYPRTEEQREKARATDRRYRAAVRDAVRQRPDYVRYKPYPEETKEKARAMYKEGYGKWLIAKKLGIMPNTVAGWIASPEQRAKTLARARAYAKAHPRQRKAYQAKYHRYHYLKNKKYYKEKAKAQREREKAANNKQRDEKLKKIEPYLEDLRKIFSK